VSEKNIAGSKSRRNVTVCVEETDERPRLFGYSVGSIAAVIGKSPKTVKRAIRSGNLEIDSLKSVAKFVSQRIST